MVFIGFKQIMSNPKYDMLKTTTKVNTGKKRVRKAKKSRRVAK